MTRATSPCSPLAISSGEIPKPIFAIGDRVVFRSKNATNKAYYFRKLVRHELKRMRRFTDEHPMCAEHKDKIRQKLRIVMEAHSIEVAGIAPRYGLNIGMVANECYLAGIQGASSPLSYANHLCFRWQDEQGQTLAYIPELAIVSEYDLAPAECSESPDATPAPHQ